MDFYHSKIFGSSSILLVSMLSLGMIVVSFNAGSFVAAQDLAFMTEKSTSNNSAVSDGFLSFSLKEGIIQPTDCDFNRIGDCFDNKNGIVYVWIENGTAILPQHFGNRSYTVTEGYAIIPLNNILRK